MQTTSPLAERTSRIQPLLLTLLFLLLALGFITGLISSRIDYCLFFGILILSFSFVSTYELKIHTHFMEVKKKYFFGIIPITYKLNKGTRIFICKYRTRDERIEFEDESTSSELWLSLLSWFIPQSLSNDQIIEGFIIKYRDENKQEKKFRIDLTKEEYTFLPALFHLIPRTNLDWFYSLFTHCHFILAIAYQFGNTNFIIP